MKGTGRDDGTAGLWAGGTAVLSYPKYGTGCRDMKRQGRGVGERREVHFAHIQMSQESAARLLLVTL